jgi:predicted ribonuclease YlaK
MFENGDVERIILSRPAVEAGDERLGFLPGDMRDKLDPYMRPLYDILSKRPDTSSCVPSPSCADAPSTMPSSCSTRCRTPRNGSSRWR